MKKLLLFILISVFCNAQESINTKKLDSLQFQNTIENAVKTTGKNFVFEKKDQVDFNTPYLVFVNEADKTEKLNIFYQISVTGGKYTINSFSGQFLTILPLWKRYADPKADESKIKAKGRIGKYTEPTMTLFSGSENNWVMRF